jgi:hypothetical protein
MYEISQDDWNRFLTEIANSTASNNPINTDRITRNEMFVRVGLQPIDGACLTAESARAILDGRPFEVVQTMLDKHRHVGAGTATGQQQQAKATS